MKEERMRCSEIECAPPFGDKKDCEFYEDGYCSGAVHPDEDAEKQMREILRKFGVSLA